MNDQFLIDLAPGWALGLDQKQWIIYRAYFKRDTARLLPVSFIGSTKATLRRCIHEFEIQLTPEASEYLDGLPDTFRAWYRRHKRRIVSTPGKVAA